MDTNIKIIVGSILFFVLMGFPACEPYEELGNGYVYLHRCIYSPHDSIRYIPSQVLDYKLDNQFIIAKQKYEDWRYLDLKNRVYLEQPPYDDDSIAFWLIDKSTGFNSGPMDTTSFSNLCAEMGVKLKFGKDDQGSCIKRLLEWLMPETKTQKENCDE